MSVIIISRGALLRNLEALRSRTGARLCAVLKCNGYGMGLLQYASMLEEAGVDAFAVSKPEEAIELRDSGFAPYLMLLTPVWDPCIIKELAGKNVALTIAGTENAAAVSTALKNGGLTARVHISIDSGMRRFGFEPSELDTFNPDGAPFSIDGVFTHFYAPGVRDITARQHNVFMNAVESLKSRGIETGLVHCCATHAFLNFPEYHHDMARLGSALVGTPDGLERIWRFEAEAASIKKLKKGDPLGYGGWKCPKTVEAASLTVGFSDGIMLERFEPVGFYGALRRFAHDLLRPSRPIRVLYEGRELPILGGAGTTHITVDITGSGAREGSVFTIESNPMFLSPLIRREYVNSF